MRITPLIWSKNFDPFIFGMRIIFLDLFFIPLLTIE